MAKWFVIFRHDISEIDFVIVEKSAVRQRNTNTYQCKWRLELSTNIPEPFSEPYVTYRYKRIKNIALLDFMVGWVIKVPDEHVLEFKLKYSDVIYSEHG